MSNTNLWMWFAQKEHISKKIKYHLLEDFYDIEKIYEAQYEDYTEIEYLKPEAIKQLCDKSCDYDDIIKQYRANNVTILTPDMEEYPRQLLATGEPPLVLYCRGAFFNLNKFMCVSVVGTRKMSIYGSNCAYNLSREMAERGVVIVSGMANGIDSRAHRGALDAGMPTVAVIGCGVNMVYPRSNTKLMKEIMETGMVVSEYPLDTPPLRHHFPERNKIISGLSVATLVVEADVKSGSLITAKRSYEYGKDVFAVPGNIDSPFCRGTNYLIKDGAYLVDSCDDIMLTYELRHKDLLERGINIKKKTENNRNFSNKPPHIRNQSIEEKKQQIKNENLSSPEDIILKVLNNDSISIDEIYEITGIDMSVLNSTLLLMELAGKITKLPGNRYTANQRKKQEEF